MTDLRFLIKAGKKCSIFFMDIDYFKFLNDVYGHLAGDRILKETVDFVKERLPAGGRIYRYGGDEFVLITAISDMEKLRSLAEKLVLVKLKEVDINTVSLSIGITVFPEEGDTPEKILNRADSALLRSKLLGRGGFLFYGDSITPEHFAFSGREKEIERFTKLIGDITRGEGRIVEVSGDAGIGKTRLVEEVARLFEKWGGVVLKAGGASFSSLPPYSLFIEMLQYLQNEKQEIFSEVMDKLPPGSKEVINVLLDEGEKRIPEDRFVVEESILAFFRTLSLLSPVMLVMDDIQWADAKSIDTMNYLASTISGFRIMLVYIVRTPGLSKKLEEVLRLFHRYPGFISVNLGPLSKENLLKLSPLIVGMDYEMIERLHKLSGGNPLFVEQLLSLPEALSSGFIGFRETPMLSTIIDTKLGRLNQDAITILRLMSLMPGSANPEILSKVSKIGNYRVMDILDLLTRLGLLKVVEEGKYAFFHGLVKWVVHNRIPVEERRRMHRAIGETLLQEKPYTNDTLFSLAHHFISAGDKERAYTFAIMAGERAEGIKGYNEAAGIYRSAMDLFKPHQEERKVLGKKIVSALTRSGSGEEAIHGVMEVLKDARIRGDVEAIPVLLYHLAYAYYRAGKFRELIKFAEKVLPELQKDSPIYWNLRFLLASVYWRIGQVAKTNETAEEGIGYFKEVDTNRLAYSYHLRSLAFIGMHRFKESLKASKRCMEIYETTEKGIPSWVFNDRGEVYYLMGKINEAEKWFGKAMDSEKERGNLWLKTGYLLNMALIEREKEDFVSSEEILKEVFEISGMAGLSGEIETAIISRGINEILQGKDWEVRTEDFREHNFLRIVEFYRGVHLLYKGEYTSAWEIFVDVWTKEKKDGFPLIGASGLLLSPLRTLTFIVASLLLISRMEDALKWNNLLHEKAEMGGAVNYRKISEFFQRILDGERPSLRPLNLLPGTFEKRLIWWMRDKILS